MTILGLADTMINYYGTSKKKKKKATFNHAQSPGKDGYLKGKLQQRMHQEVWSAVRKYCIDGLQNKRNSFLTALEAGSPRSGC